MLEYLKSLTRGCNGLRKISDEKILEDCQSTMECVLTHELECTCKFSTRFKNESFNNLTLNHYQNNDNNQRDNNSIIA